MKKNIVLMFAFAFSACSSMLTYVPPHYSVAADNTLALKKLGAGNINVGPFTKTAEFDNNCGITAGVVGMPDNLSFAGYIQKGLVDELRLAGMLDDATPKITLTGIVEQLSFFSRRTVYTSTWNIGLRVNSSNGKSVHVSDRYDFDAGAFSAADCQKIADYYMPAVQKILGKLITAPEFQSLVTP